jgi:hypothetical protein
MAPVSVYSTIKSGTRLAFFSYRGERVNGWWLVVAVITLSIPGVTYAESAYSFDASQRANTASNYGIAFFTGENLNFSGNNNASPASLSGGGGMAGLFSTFMAASSAMDEDPSSLSGMGMGGRSVGGTLMGGPGGPSSTSLGVRAGLILSPSATVNLNAAYGFPDFPGSQNPDTAAAMLIRGSSDILLSDSLAINPNFLYRSLALPTGSPFPSTFALANMSARFKVAQEINLYTNVGYAFYQGITDPILGIAYHTAGLKMALQASAPISQMSQNQSLITTLTAIGGPSFRSGGFSTSMITFFAYSIYGGPSAVGNPTTTKAVLKDVDDDDPQAEAPSPSDPAFLAPARVVVRSGGNLNIAYNFTKVIRGTSGVGVFGSYYDDGSSNWMSQANVAGAAFSFDDLTLSANFWLVSDPSQVQAISVPTFPGIGVRLEYLFGNRGALNGVHR